MTGDTGIGEGFSGNYLEPDPLQAKMADPEHMANALYADHNFVVMADDYPVAPHHLLVVARQEKPLEELEFQEQQALWALAMVTSAHMTRVLHPERKVSVSVWGNQVETAHIHLVPRRRSEDATHWKRQRFAREEDRLAQLQETYQLLKFTSDVQAAAELAVQEAMLRTAAVTIPKLYPGMRTPGKNK
jgi:diadenosine tetraphosphate (Ap4A) HIT family hydrolase